MLNIEEKFITVEKKFKKRYLGNNIFSKYKIKFSRKIGDSGISKGIVEVLHLKNKKKGEIVGFYHFNHIPISSFDYNNDILIYSPDIMQAINEYK